MSGSASLLTIQLLSWLAARPRSYAELKEAWRTDRASVVLTPRGRAVLAAASDERRGSPPAPFPLDPAGARL